AIIGDRAAMRLRRSAGFAAVRKDSFVSTPPRYGTMHRIVSFSDVRRDRCSKIPGGGGLQSVTTDWKEAVMHWAETVLTCLKEQQIRLMVYVPDNVLIPLIAGAQADPHWTAFTATREEEAIGIACGADMGGMRAVVLMQSSGFGNTLNVL